MTARKFLFLQGVATPFFRQLAKAIVAAGHEVYRVNFCGGDWWFSIGVPSWEFRGSAKELPAWLTSKFAEYQFTDVILFGDTRPVHLQAVKVARNARARIHVYEEGYLRPDWITLEREGVNAYSPLFLKKDSEWYQGYPIFAPKQNLPTNNRLPVRLWHDICYRMANLLLLPLYPHYKTHRPHWAHLEYFGWIRRFITFPSKVRQCKKAIAELTASGRNYFFFPLQLDSDAQIRIHSPFNSMQDAIQHVLTSFAKHAHLDDLLVIKNHPLDTGLVNHKKKIRQVAQSLGIAERVVYLETGHLPTLIQHARGTVVVNSTVGMSSLFHHCPTFVLGKAIYDLPGLVSKGGLNRFWVKPAHPNDALFKQFRAALIEATQVNGNFYTQRGIELAVEGSLQTLQIIPRPQILREPVRPVEDMGAILAHPVKH